MVKKNILVPLKYITVEHILIKITHKNSIVIKKYVNNYIAKNLKL